MKYQILEIPTTDQLHNYNLIGKICVGSPELHANETNLYSGGLIVSFNTQKPVFKTFRDNKTTRIDYYKTITTDQYIFFHNVRLKKVAN